MTTFELVALFIAVALTVYNVVQWLIVVRVAFQPRHRTRKNRHNICLRALAGIALACCLCLLDSEAISWVQRHWLMVQAPSTATTMNVAIDILILATLHVAFLYSAHEALHKQRNQTVKQ